MRPRRSTWTLAPALDTIPDQWSWVPERPAGMHGYWPGHSRFSRSQRADRAFCCV